MKKLTALFFVGLMLSVSACGGNGDDDKASTAISDSIMKSQKSGGDILAVKRDDADCIGKGLVNSIGVDQLKKYGVLTKDAKTAKSISAVKMSKDDAKSATDTLFSCTDVMAMIDKTMEQQGAMNPAMKKCIDKVLTEDAVHSMFESMFVGKTDEASKALVGPLTKCATAPLG